MVLLGPAVAIGLPAVVLQGSRGYWELMRSWETGTTSAVEAEIRLADPRRVRRVVLGSSVALTDLDEGLLDRRLGQPEGATLNLGIKGGSAAVSAMLTPEVAALEPELVLFVVHTDNLRERPEPTEPAAGRQRGVPPSTIYDPSVARHICPSRTYATDRAYHLAGALGSVNLLVRHRLDLRYLASRFLLHRGVPPRRHDPRSFGRLGDEALREDLAAAGGPLRFDREGASFRGLVFATETLAGTGIRLVVVPAPDHPGVRGEPYPASFVDLLTELRDRCGLELIHPAAFPEFGDADFLDHHHMGRSGRLRFTATVAEYLKAGG